MNLRLTHAPGSPIAGHAKTSECWIAFAVAKALCYREESTELDDPCADGAVNTVTHRQ